MASPVHRSTLCAALGSAIGILLAAVSAAASGCTTHQCDASEYAWPPRHDGLPDGGFTVGGYMLDPDTYVSNDRNHDWLDFRRNTTIQIYFPPEAACRVPKSPWIEIGTAETPNSAAAFAAAVPLDDASRDLDRVSDAVDVALDGAVESPAAE